jgi:hypothetical protein
LYRRDASEAWHEIAYTVYAGSTWKHGRFIVDNLPSGEYTIAAWDKEALGTEEQHEAGMMLQMYPNPSADMIRLSWDEPSDGMIRIIGMDGRELRRAIFRKAEGVSLSTAGLPKGYCTVMRLGKDGTVLATEKLIIK